MSDIKELKDEELEKVSGGSQPNTLEQGPKYQLYTQIKGYYDGILITGEIQKVEWNTEKNQYAYTVDHDIIRYVKNLEVFSLPARNDTVYEEDVLYVL